MSKGYRSPRNVIFSLMERGGLFTLDDVAHACHLNHNTAERALNSLIQLQKVRQDGKWFMVTDQYQVPWALMAWDILGERLLERMTKETGRYLRYCNIWAWWGGRDATSDQTESPRQP